MKHWDFVFQVNGSKKEINESEMKDISIGAYGITRFSKLILSYREFKVQTPNDQIL